MEAAEGASGGAGGGRSASAVSADSDDDTAAGAAFAFSPRFGGMLNMCGQRERELIREVRIGLVAFMRYTFGRQCRLLFAQSLYAEAAGRALAFLQQQGALIMQRQDNLARAWANEPAAGGHEPAARAIVTRLPDGARMPEPARRL